ncbi:hypothetical protein PG985_003257 [Apiospora marii]|uniref:uncharacterized protein n=1 Tax=Apiospora marii TaxID=335849 RepID=UPI00312D9216
MQLGFYTEQQRGCAQVFEKPFASLEPALSHAHVTVPAGTEVKKTRVRAELLDWLDGYWRLCRIEFPLEVWLGGYACRTTTTTTKRLDIRS